MEKIHLNNVNPNFNINENNQLNFEKGQTYLAKILENTPSGVLLKINNTVFQAKTEHEFPVNTQLFLTVISQTDEQTILSLKNHINYYNLDISSIVHNLGLDDSSEIRLLIEKLIETKQHISKENIEAMKQLINRLPLEYIDSLDIISDPSIFLGIFSFLSKDAGFSLFLNEKNTNHNQKSHLEVNILYQSNALGFILTNVSWCEKIKITIKCSLESTYKLIQTDLEMLKQKINVFVSGNVDLIVVFDNDLVKKIHAVKEEQKTKLLGIDIRI